MSARFLGRLFLVLGVMLMMSGCAAPAAQLLQGGDSGAPQWPDPPMRAKIRWVKSVTVPRDAGIRRSVWRHALDFVTGAEADNIVKPHGVLYDEAGRLFVADTGIGVVHLMDTGKGSYKRISGPPGSPFRAPIGLAQDERGGLFITDSASDTVYRYDLAGGEVTPFFRDVSRPTGIIYNKANKLLYISETGLGRVVAVDAAGKQKLTIDTEKTGEGFFNKPIDLAVDAKGRVYVNDPLNYKVNVFTPDGRLLFKFGEMGGGIGEMNKPKGIAVDSLGQIYVCDALHDTVQLFDPEGRFLFNFGANGTRAGEFWMPSGIYIQNDFVFVSDTYNGRIQIFRALTWEEHDEDDDLMQPQQIKR